MWRAGGRESVADWRAAKTSPHDQILHGLRAIAEELPRSENSPYRSAESGEYFQLSTVRNQVHDLLDFVR